MVETWTTAALTTMWTVEAQLERLLRGTILATGLETMSVILGKECCSILSRFLRHCPRLNLKVLDYFFGGGDFKTA